MQSTSSSADIPELSTMSSPSSSSSSPSPGCTNSVRVCKYTCQSLQAAWYSSLSLFILTNKQNIKKKIRTESGKTFRHLSLVTLFCSLCRKFWRCWTWAGSLRLVVPSHCNLLISVYTEFLSYQSAGKPPHSNRAGSWKHANKSQVWDERLSTTLQMQFVWRC